MELKSYSYIGPGNVGSCLLQRPLCPWDRPLPAKPTRNTDGLGIPWGLIGVDGPGPVGNPPGIEIASSSSFGSSGLMNMNFKIIIFRQDNVVDPQKTLAPLNQLPTLPYAIPQK